MIKEVHGGNIYKYDRDIYDFSANLNPLGMAEEIKEAIILSVDQYQAYPDPFNRDLKEAVAGSEEVSPDLLVFGNGAADIIFRIPEALKPEKALIVEPTFSEYEEGLRLAGCQVDYFQLKEEDGFRLNLDQLIKALPGHDICYICNPNNPTGIPIGREEMVKLAEECDRLGMWLVVDQCFSDFLPEEEDYVLTRDIGRLSKVILLKAFTKIYAMAGMRLGYAICSEPETAERIQQAGQPWTVSTPASVAGCAALKLEGFVERTKAYVAEERGYLMRDLSKLGIKTYDSRANYILLKSEEDIFTPLEARGIVIRKCGNYPFLDESYYRIAVRTAEENRHFITVLTEVMAGIRRQK